MRKLREPKIVMEPERLGGLFGSRLSFARTFLRALTKGRHTIELDITNLDAKGYGHCVYNLRGTKGFYSLVIFSQEVSAHERTDRVIATKWDISCGLLLGKVTPDQIEMLSKQIPLQEAGTFTKEVLSLSRANKSVATFDRCIKSLVDHTEDWGWLTKKGYLLRTSAVYGNRKFGIAAFEDLHGTDFETPFLAQMAVVYMLREFSFHLVESIASEQKGSPCSLPLEVKRNMGVGNATGLGMVTFFVRHPGLTHQWIYVRETIRSEVLAMKPSREDWWAFAEYLKDVLIHLDESEVSDKPTQDTNSRIKDEVQVLLEAMALGEGWTEDWQGFLERVQPRLHHATEELVVNLLMEVYPDTVDSKKDQMAFDESLELDETTTVSALRRGMEKRYKWILQSSLDSTPDRYWYESIHKKEPSFCPYREKNEALGKPLNIGLYSDIIKLYQDLGSYPATTQMGVFLADHPWYRPLATRVYLTAPLDYSEWRGNLLSNRESPLHLLRLKLSFLGAQKFDPRSDRWIRVTFFQGAPLANEFCPESHLWSFAKNSPA